MIINPSKNIEGLYVIEPKVFSDERGYFVEQFHKNKYFDAFNVSFDIVQENESFSTKGVIRGMHLQRSEFAQAKLIRVIQGEIYDVAVDLRKGSQTFGQWEAVTLSEKNKKQFFIPRGFAHGFLVLSEQAVVNYLCDNIYEKESESGIRFDDPDVQISWPKLETNYIVSEKDLRLPNFQTFKNKE